ncbi:MAG: DinB family protein [Micromonosporaceae bacterium]|nr:DinB family protein [Micromonosporaceae bacterium]
MEERIIAADPVADPQGYQREVLALLGGRDPVEVLEATVPAVRGYTDGLSQQVLNRRPEPGEWSAAEVLGHLFDGEVAFAYRSRMILAQDTPTLSGYDQDAWARLPRPGFTELLDAFAALRLGNLALVRQLAPEAWQRVGVHSERGPTTMRVLVETTAGHDIAHLRQLEQTLVAVRA